MSIARRTISDSTKALIDSLYRPVPFWSRQAKHRKEALASLAASGETAAIFDIAPLLLDRSRNVRQAAADAIGHLVRLLNADDYFWLDQGMRRGGYSQSSVAWNRMATEQVESLESLGRNACYALGMASAHWSGFVRQRALLRLSEVMNGAELPFLLVRLKDWVYDVRVSAAGLVSDRLRPTYAVEFAKYLPIIVRLKASARGKDLEVLAGVESFLKSADGRDALTAGIQSPDKSIRRYSLKLAWSSDTPNVDKLRQVALKDLDPVIRDMGAHSIALIADEGVAREALATARDDRFVSVRRTAMKISFERFPGESRPWLEDALLDSNPAIRGFAQFHSERKYGIVGRDFYLRALSSPNLETKSLDAAISGLGEVGRAEDSTRVLPYASDKSPRIRRAVMRTLGRLHPDKFIDALLEGLGDASGRVSRESVRALNKVPILISASTVWDRVKHSPFSHVRLNALSLISHFSKWESIGYLLEAQCAEHEDVKVRSGAYIRKWVIEFNRTFTTPSKAQKDHIVYALAGCGTFLSKGLRELLVNETKQ